MHAAQGWRGQAVQWDGVIAVTITVVVQAGLAWLLARAMQPPPRVTASTETMTEVMWLPRAVVSPPPATDAMPPPRGTAQRGSRPQVGAPSTLRGAEAEHGAVVESSRPMAAVYLMQARQNAQAGATGGHDPLADRQVRLPGEGEQRFRMRPPPGGVAAVVSKVGRLFGAEDAAAPCRETSRNINDLALDGDSAQLQQQIDRERRLCRP